MADINKKALISGISGQDGSYLAELLLEKDYKVFGIIRRQSVPENQLSRIEHILNNIETEYGDLTDRSSIDRIIKLVKPNEIYNLASQSHVRVSFDIPEFTVMTNAVGVLNILESYCENTSKECKFYQASSSEMFGLSIDSDGYQREITPMYPTSPYGCAKLFGYSLARHYRRAYKRFVCNGILFNHTSPRRASTFVEAKIVKTAVEISKGLKDKLILGNPNSKRDFGHSKDYTKAMHMIMQHNIPDDFVIASGQTRSIKDIVLNVFKKLDISINKVQWFNNKYLRPEDLSELKGDSSKARAILGWKPEYDFDMIIDEMIEWWMGKVVMPGAYINGYGAPLTR
jgi:GDPmannose 4,6-dehydratase